MIKITTIFGEDAVREYEENNELPSEEWLADNGGVVDEKEFETEAEYNAYIAGVNDADGWSDYHIIRHRSEEADTSREENLWLRLGISVRGSREDIERILNGDTETLRKLLDAGPRRARYPVRKPAADASFRQGRHASAIRHLA